MSGTIITANGTLSGVITENVTVTQGVSLTAFDMSLTGGNTLFANGFVDLANNDALLTSPTNAQIIIGSAGTLEIGSGFGLANNGQIDFGAAGGTLVIDAGVNLSILDYIGNVQAGDGIVLKGMSAATVTEHVSGGETYVYLFGAGGSLLGNFEFTSSNVDATSFSLSKVSGNLVVEAHCFLAGTGIATPAGDVAVEDLKAGDLVLTAAGEARPVRWLGRSTIATRFADPVRVLPVRIAAGALGEGLPVRDLLVSPDHALFLDGLLVQASALVNGTSITREHNMPETFAYYHVELASHELIVAEGVVAESFVDNAGRLSFDNASERPQAAPVAELAYPRVKAARQLPVALRTALAA